MNAQRRSQLLAIQVQVSDLQGRLEAIQEDEQAAFDNMPESLQSGEKGEPAEAALEAIENAISGLMETYGELANIL